MHVLSQQLKLMVKMIHKRVVWSFKTGEILVMGKDSLIVSKHPQ